MQYEENKTLVPSLRTQGPIAIAGGCHPRQRLQPLQITSICGYRPLRSQGRQIKTNKNKKDPGRNRGPIDEDGLARRLLVATLLERGTENVAQRRPRIGGAVLRDGLLLFGDFERLDRDLHLAGLLVELDHPRIDLLADGETLGALVGALARQFGPLDEGGEIGPGDPDLDAAFLDLEHLAGHDRALLDVARLGERIALKLLDAERDALLLDIDIEHHGLDHVALLEVVDHLLARKLPVEIGQMDHAVDITLEAEEQAELGLVLDLALDRRSDREFLDEHFPGIAHGLLEAERNPALDRIDFQNLHFDFLRSRNDLAGVHVLLGPRHFRDVDQAFDARLQFNERAVVGDVGDAAGEARIERILRLDALPRIVQQLLHAERDAVGFVIDLDDLHLHRLADGQNFGRMVDPAPGDIGDVQQAVDAAEVDERTVIGDVLDDTVDDLTFFEILHQFLALLGAGLFQHGAARHHDVAAAAIHLEDLERLRVVHQRCDVADRPDIDLRARQEGHRTVEIDGEAALDLIEDDAVHLLVVVEGLLELAPAFLAARLVARQHGLAERILDAVEKHLDLIADLEFRVAAGSCEFTQRHAAFGLQADVDDGHVLLDRDNGALDDGAFLQIAAGEGLVEHGGEIVAGRMVGSSSRSHLFSRCGYRRLFGLRGVSGVKCQRSANPGDRSLRKIRNRGPAAKLHVRYVDIQIFIRDLNEANRPRDIDVQDLERAFLQ